VRAGGRTLLLTTPQPVSVGRDNAASVVVSDERASRRHGLIRVDHGEWIYEDLASTNGSWLEGARVNHLAIDVERAIRIGNPVNGELVQLVPGTAAPQKSRRPAILVASTIVLVALFAANLWTSSRPAATDSAATPAVSPTVSVSASTALTTSDVAAIGKASTVKLTQGNVLGTGIYLGDGQILTAAHVVSSAGVIAVLFDEVRIGSATVLRFDKNDDLALLSGPRLESFGGRPIVWGDSASLREGDSLVTLGYPAGLPLSVKFGVVSGLRQDGTTQLIQTDASVNPGMSGGPVLNANGRLVGVNDFISTRYPGLSFAVASTTVRDFLDGRR